MAPELEKRIARVAADRESGASEILDAAIAILRDAMAEQMDMQAVANGLRRAQPSMAPVWNATAAALAGNLEHFAQRVARAPDAIARFAVELLETGASAGTPLRVVTLSYSGTVAHVLEAVARHHALAVSCSEGRPALEGRRLASRLAAAGIPVSYYLDAAIGGALESADAVVVGADAVASDYFVNKSGTRMLAAAATQRAVPVYLLAGREKFVAPAAQVTLRSGLPSEVWPDPAAGVVVENPYFERIPVELVSAIVTDTGVLSSADAAEVCAFMSRI